MKSKYWIPTVIIAFILSTITAFPDSMISESDYDYNLVCQKAAHPFTNVDYNPISHESKLTFRLTVPLLVKALNLNSTGVFILQYFFGFLLLFLTAKISYSIFENNLYATLITISIAQVFSGTTAFVESISMFDGFAFVFLLAAIYSRRTVIIASSILLAGFCDERALVASLFVIAYHIKEENYNFKGMIKSIFEPKCMAVIIGVFLYVILRAILVLCFGLKTATGDIGFYLIPEQLLYSPIALWTALEGFIIIVVLAMITLLQRREYTYALFYTGCFLAVITVSLMVLDVTRSMAYLLPGIFVALKLMKRNHNYNIKKILIAVLLISAICPNFYVCGNDCFIWCNSLIVRILTNTF